MKRYDIERIDYDMYVINEQDAGDYVLYSDVAPLVEALRNSRRELQSCQAVIHLHGGFDPNYVYAAQESLRETDAVLCTLDADGSARQ